MARLASYYDFHKPISLHWEAQVFPDGDNTQIPDETGVYRFVTRATGENQTLYADFAPSTYGESLRECYNHHVAIRSDPYTELFSLYTKSELEFHHFQCANVKAKEHKQALVSDLNPPYNKVQMRIALNPIMNPFQN